MDTGDKAAPVTRGEFNSALLLVWTFIMLAFSTIVFDSSRSPVSAPAKVVYLMASFVMVANYGVASLRGGASRKGVVVAALLAAAAVAVGAVAFFAGRTSH